MLGDLDRLFREGSKSNRIMVEGFVGMVLEPFVGGGELGEFE